MSIYISGIEMPSHGSITLTIRADGFVQQQKEKPDYEPPNIGEAIEVPSHGRLGDLDELRKEAVRRSEKAGPYDSWYNCIDRVISAFDIECAPTIIPAEPSNNLSKPCKEDEAE